MLDSKLNQIAPKIKMNFWFGTRINELYYKLQKSRLI